MNRYTYIVPAGQITAIRNKLKQEDAPTGLDGMFTTPMSPSGNHPATHYVSSGILSDAQVAFLDANLPKPFRANFPNRNPFDVFSNPKDATNLKIISEAA